MYLANANSRKALDIHHTKNIILWIKQIYHKNYDQYSEGFRLFWKKIVKYF